MPETAIKAPASRSATVQAVIVWCVFISVLLLLNGTIPFALGKDLRGWTYSETKFALIGFFVYGIIFFAIPIVLSKGWHTARRLDFLLPMLAAILAVSFWHAARGVVFISLVVVAYLHWRFDLSTLGLRSRGLRGDTVSVALLVFLSLLPGFLKPASHTASLGQAMLAGVERLFFNPASSMENIFYFGFLAERLSKSVNRWLTSSFIGLMYSLHEITNPEYWYQSVSFPLVFVSVFVTCLVFLWRRSVPVIWLGSGLARAATRLL